MITTENPEKLRDIVKVWFENQKRGKKTDRRFIKNQIKLARKNRNIQFAIIHLILLLTHVSSKESALEIYELVSFKISKCSPCTSLDPNGKKLDENWNEEKWDTEKWKWDKFIEFIFKNQTNPVIESACLAQLLVLDTHIPVFEHENREAIEYLDKLRSRSGYSFKENLRKIYQETCLQKGDSFA